MWFNVVPGVEVLRDSQSHLHGYNSSDILRQGDSDRTAYQLCLAVNWELTGSPC